MNDIYTKLLVEKGLLDKNTKNITTKELFRKAFKKCEKDNRIRILNAKKITSFDELELSIASGKSFAYNIDESLRPKLLNIELLSLSDDTVASIYKNEIKSPYKRSGVHKIETLKINELKFDEFKCNYYDKYKLTEWCNEEYKTNSKCIEEVLFNFYQQQYSSKSFSSEWVCY